MIFNSERLTFKSALPALALILLMGCQKTPSQSNVLDTPKTPEKVAPSATHIITDKAFGPVQANTTEAALKAMLGKNNVRDGAFYIAEGFCEAGTVIYPDDETRRLTLVWTDPKTRTRPRMAQIEGTSSIWKTTHGVSLGTTAAELEALNGQSFKFYGLGWDYGGDITDWQGGKLELPLSSIMLHIDYRPKNDPEGTQITTYGDQEFSSADLKAVAGDVRVDELTFVFRDNILENPDEGEHQVPCEELENTSTKSAH